MCSDHKSTIFEDDSTPKEFGRKLFEKHIAHIKTYCVAVVQDLVQRTSRPQSQPRIIFKQKEVFQEIDR